MVAQWYDVMTRDAGDPGSNPALGKVITLPGTGPAQPLFHALQQTFTNLLSGN